MPLLRNSRTFVDETSFRTGWLTMKMLCRYSESTFLECTAESLKSASSTSVAARWIM
jgi:hypothetical protein